MGWVPFLYYFLLLIQKKSLQVYEESETRKSINPKIYIFCCLDKLFYGSMKCGSAVDGSEYVEVN